MYIPKKMSFISATALVISSQVGSGIFMLPSSLALLGPISLFGWVISGTCATLLALIFAKLCLTIPKAGGAAMYVEAAFGKNVAFFTGWTYWLVYSISDTAVIIAAVGYLAPLLGATTPLSNFFLEVILFLIITLLNIRGVVLSASVELILTILKCIPLIIIPIAGIFFLKAEHFYPMNPHNLNTVNVLSQAAFITLWGFLGLESATAASGVIVNFQRTAAKAVIFGTIFVVALYILNNIGIMAVVPPQILVSSNAPYAEATKIIFGQGLDIVIALVAFITCLGTLNAGILAGGQISYNAAKEKLFPSVFAKTNKYDSPYLNLILSFLIKVALLLMTLDDALTHQFNRIINIAIADYLFIYILCIASFIKLNKKNKFFSVLSLIPLVLCGSLLISNSTMDILLSCLPIISGIPIYLWQNNKLNIVTFTNLFRKKEVEN